MRQLLSQIRRDERGASILEMALTAPFLGAMVIGMVDISRGYNAKLELEQFAQRAVEKAMQGMQGDESQSIFQGLQAETAAAAGVATNKVEIRYWLECNGVKQNTNVATQAADYEKKCPDGQVYSRHLNVKIEKKYYPMFETKFLGSNPDGSFDLIGESGLRVQ